MEKERESIINSQIEALHGDFSAAIAENLEVQKKLAKLFAESRLPTHDNGKWDGNVSLNIALDGGTTRFFDISNGGDSLSIIDIKVDESKDIYQVTFPHNTAFAPNALYRHTDSNGDETLGMQQEAIVKITEFISKMNGSKE